MRELAGFKSLVISLAANTPLADRSWAHSVIVKGNPVTERVQQSVLRSKPQSPTSAEKLRSEFRTSYVAIAGMRCTGDKISHMLNGRLEVSFSRSGAVPPR